MFRREGSGVFGPYGDGPTNVEVLPSVDDAMRLEKTEQWRFDRLRHAGYTESQSLMLAIQRHADVDLHKAVALARLAGPDVAYRIVS